MATVTKDFADKLIAGNGWLADTDRDAPDNPPAVRITEYTDMGGKKAYGVVFQGGRNLDKYQHHSDYIRTPKIYWDRSELDDEEPFANGPDTNF
jgi:hypothetical protein